MTGDLAPLDAMPDGQLVSDVQAALGVGKSTTYKYLGELQIKPETHRNKAWLSGAEVELLTSYARHRGARLSAAEALAAVGRGALVVSPPPPQSSEMTAESADGDREQLELLALQLQALSKAVELGAPLTTRQVRLLLGARPGGDRVSRAGIEALKLGHNLWQLRSAKEKG